MNEIVKEEPKTRKKPRREKAIKIRMTEQEHQTLLQLMQGNELATWIRETCLSLEDEQKQAKKVAQQEIKPIDPTILRELNKIGVNMNQIAKAINSHNLIDRIAITQSLSIISEQLNEVLEKL
ncbi:plasmid mobilization relaxosome protein MobC [Acinetobacter sp. B10A]|uniref:plasmid mobilization relaxosome protein MobC n=1 Tax=Acinetobacter baretiae TaxID=2605383 RepID=UPI001B3C5F21|nr:plasmid mobilization relaxosome protein MobC [Acinetobacter baretiae]MBF7686507.1 plasmid mobilization relaxosome protein MobC [Acinetobacter baretiae]MBF7686514.1 plasmid mobilization relaxosome protein MobC [Acinetobacter baretiae]